MAFHPLKLLFYLVAAALEVTLLHLIIVLGVSSVGAESSLSWFALFVTALIGAWATLRFEPLDTRSDFVQRPTLIACAVTVSYAVKIQAGGGWLPWSGWGVLWPFTAGNFSTFELVGLLIVSLWAWWRGMALIDHDHTTILRTLLRGTLLLIALTLILTPLSTVNLGAPPIGTRLAAEGIAVIALGLVALSLARITSEDEQQANGWQRLRSSAITIMGITVAGTLALSLISNTATEALRALLFVIFAGFALLVSPLAQLLAGLAQPTDELLASPVPSPSGLALPSVAPLAEQPGGNGFPLFEAFITMLAMLLVLAPLIMIVLLILLMRRRGNMRRTDDGALHESLWSWRRIGDDLRGLLNNLHLPARTMGLRAALGRLRTDDPVQRIRRRYVEALLLGAAEDRERAPQQTPLEYQPTLAALAPTAERAVQTLTNAYDRARYAPDTIEAADASTADEAWDQIKSQARNS